MEDESVDLIYCDILYNTGKKFRDFDDNLGSPQEAIEWYRPRIREMHRVLKDTGSIYLQCDHRLVHYLKVLMDKIFGLDRFRNEIIWDSGSVSGGKSRANNWIMKHDNILYYVKNIDSYTFNKKYLPYNDSYLSSFRPDEKGDLYRLRDGKRVYLKNLKGMPISNVWSDIKSFQTITQAKEYTGYNTQKPKALLERIIRASSNEGDTVADFFCGSGTTGVVAKELGRNYILCDINPKAVEISERRISEVQRRLFTL